MSGSQPLDDAVLRLCERLGYSFTDKGLLLDALTHRSFKNERPDVALADNERLEFLGDAVVGLMVASLLYAQFPDSDEGELTRRRADLVSERGLFEAAESIGIGDAMRLGKGEEKSGGRSKSRLLENALEACLGAIYLDGGADAAFEAARRIFEPRLHTSAPGLRDAKSRAQEWAQAHLGGTPSYRIVGTEGPDHDREFTVALELNEEEVATGTGRSKLAAEQAAAQTALNLWVQTEDPPP
ncbi:MAG: ribonuclease III [Deltaproteobacteria bacterium]|nr:ribonuclease III [Deltaproteobacteria bacterium]MBW2223577.1 ribonuclease III [Deltaproteobacteria bacterium]MBW2404910.1 ribonuclease III [Deltaproteobacteria bacterium]MBW2546699.1 ribonuclease III [Deltaproteobacteria bacterium]MBW2718943.1 ribonuclease III [Deltaproteobacteria bacterium]